MRTEETVLEPCPDGEYLCLAGRENFGSRVLLLLNRREEVLDLPESRYTRI